MQPLTESPTECEHPTEAKKSKGKGKKGKSKKGKGKKPKVNDTS